MTLFIQSTGLATPDLLSNEDKENVTAILNAYRNASLVPQAGIPTYWYKGIQRENPGPPLHREEALSRWKTEHGDHRLLIECKFLFLNLIMS
jgi:hypothetical protein